MRFYLPALALISAISAPVMAENPAPEAKLPRDHPDAVRCKRLDVTGSLVKKERVCKTNAQWRAIAEQNNRDADDIITRSRSGMNPNG